MTEAKRYFPEGGSLGKDIVATGERRIPFRPLGALSNLVIEEMPDALMTAKRGDARIAFTLLSRAEILAAQMEADDLPELETPEFGVARLDVLMLYAGFAHSGIRIGSNLSRIVGALSQGSIPALTYEDVVLNNPTTDPRTFTHGEVGADEEHFYGIHQDLEHAIRPAVVSLRQAISTHTRNYESYDRGEALDTKEKADSALQALDVLIANTRTVGRSMKYFDAFRSYLNPIPAEYLGPTLPQVEYAGPSGAYSGTVHAMDVLIQGFLGRVPVTDEVVRYLQANRMYIPHVDYPILDDALEFATRDKKFLHVRDKNNRNLVDTMIAYAEKLLMFRRIHVGSVTRQVPSVMKNSEEIGTGGICGVAGFLGERVKRTEEAIGKLRTIRYRQDMNRMQLF